MPEQLQSYQIEFYGRLQKSDNRRDVSGGALKPAGDTLHLFDLPFKLGGSGTAVDGPAIFGDLDASLPGLGVQVTRLFYAHSAPIIPRAADGAEQATFYEGGEALAGGRPAARAKRSG